MKKLNLEQLERLDIEQFKATQKHPITIVLDNIRSALNVGSFFRTGDAFACEQIILTGITSIPPHPEISKSAIGADRSMEWSHNSSVAEALSILKQEGVYIVGIEQTDQSALLDNCSLPEGKRIALVFGNEVEGLSEAVLPHLDMAIEVPQYGTKHSLNVAVCGGVVIWDILQKIKGQH